MLIRLKRNREITNFSKNADNLEVKKLSYDSEGILLVHRFIYLFTAYNAHNMPMGKGQIKDKMAPDLKVTF